MEPNIERFISYLEIQKIILFILEKVIIKIF